MTTVDCITTLFDEVDEQLHAIPTHPEAHLWPSEVGTLGLLHARKGGGNQALYRWHTRDYRALFPCLPERTRLFRLFTTHQDWTTAFLATPTKGRRPGMPSLPCGARRRWWSRSGEGLVATIRQASWEAAWYDGGLTMRPQSAPTPAESAGEEALGGPKAWRGGCEVRVGAWWQALNDPHALSHP